MFLKISEALLHLVLVLYRLPGTEYDGGDEHRDQARPEANEAPCEEADKRFPGIDRCRKKR